MTKRDKIRLKYFLLYSMILMLLGFSSATAHNNPTTSITIAYICGYTMGKLFNNEESKFWKK